MCLELHGASIDIQSICCYPADAQPCFLQAACAQSKGSNTKSVCQLSQCQKETCILSDCCAGKPHEASVWFGMVSINCWVSEEGVTQAMSVGCMAVEMCTGEPLFPGDSDVDQLWLILKCMGQLPPAYAEMLSRNEYFAVMPPTIKSGVSEKAVSVRAWICLWSGTLMPGGHIVLFLESFTMRPGHEAARLMGEGAT